MLVALAASRKCHVNLVSAGETKADLEPLSSPFLLSISEKVDAKTSSRML